MINKLALWLLLCGVLLTACGPTPPDIALVPTHADLGEVSNGEIRQIEVEIQNTGGSSLHIEQISTSCGCTTAEVDPLVIPSGSTAILSINFDSGAHGPDFVGSIQREVFLTSNDPDEEEVTFKFSAEVISADP